MPVVSALLEMVSIHEAKRTPPTDLMPEMNVLRPREAAAKEAAQ